MSGKPGNIAVKVQEYDQPINMYESASTSHHQQNEDSDEGSSEPPPAGQYIALVD